MGRLAVVTQRLAVIARDDDKRRPARGPHIVEERQEGGVGRSHFAIVRIRGVLRVEGRRRAIRRVRIEHMHPRKPAVGLMPADPRARQRHDRSRRPFGHDELGRVAGLAKAIVVDVEAVAQAEPRVQRERCDERPGCVTGLPEQGCDRARIRGQSIAAVVAQPVLKRIETRQDRGV